MDTPPRGRRYFVKREFHNSVLAIKLAPLDVDAKLANGHAQILHGQHRAVLAAALSAAAISRPLDTQWSTPALVFVTGLVGWLSGNGKAGGGAQVAHWVVGVSVARADATVLVGVSGNVGDKLLCC